MRWRWLAELGSSYITRRSSSGPEPTARAVCSISAGDDRRALVVVREHVGQAHERGLALGVGLWWRSITVAMRRRQAPAAGEHAAHERMVDAQLAALLVDALLGRLRPLVHLRGVARVGVHQHELADVVQQACDGQPVAVLVADLGRDAVGGVLGGQRVQPEALGRGVPARWSARRSRTCARWLASACDRLRAEQLYGADDGVDALARVRTPSIGEAQHRDDQRDVGLDGGDDVGGRDVVLGDDRSRRLRDSDERREGLERLECCVRRRPWPSFWWRSPIHPSCSGVAQARSGSAGSLPCVGFVTVACVLVTPA